MKRSNGTLKGMARQMLLGHYQVPMIAAILASCIPALALLPFSYLCSRRATNVTEAVTYYLAAFMISLIELLLGCGVKQIHLQLARGQQVRVSDMFRIWKQQPDRILIGGCFYLLLSYIPQIPALIYDLTTPAGSGWTQSAIIFAISSLLTHAGGILGFLLTLPFYLIFWICTDDPDVSVTDAFRRSVRMMRGGKWRLCVMELSFIGWVLLGSLSLGIGFLWITPYMNQTMTNFYLEQKGAFDVTMELSQSA